MFSGPGLLLCTRLAGSWLWMRFDDLRDRYPGWLRLADGPDLEYRILWKHRFLAKVSHNLTSLNEGRDFRGSRVALGEIDRSLVQPPRHVSEIEYSDGLLLRLGANGSEGAAWPPVLSLGTNQPSVSQLRLKEVQAFVLGAAEPPDGVAFNDHEDYSPLLQSSPVSPTLIRGRVIWTKDLGTPCYNPGTRSTARPRAVLHQATAVQIS